MRSGLRVDSLSVLIDETLGLLVESLSDLSAPPVVHLTTAIVLTAPGVECMRQLVANHLFS